MATFEVGHRFDIGPLPHDPGSTTLVPAGRITFGVEYREVDQAALVAGFGAEAATATAAGFEEEGVSIHVFGTDDDHEYLRFDCFAGDAHYHYITPGSHQTIVPVDQVANGDVMNWSFRVLEERLPAMLEHVGAPDLAVAAASPEVARALNEVRAIAERAVQEQAAQTADEEEVASGA